MASVKGIIVEIGGDTSKLQSALKKVNSSTSSLSKELKGINSLLKLDPKNAELVAQKQKVLTEEINETENKLKLLHSTYQRAVEAEAEGAKISEENWRNLQREIINTENKLKQLNLENSKWTTAGRSIEEFGNKVNNISNKLDKMGTTLTTKLTLPIVGFATTAIASMDAVDEGLDTVAVKTGATGEAAKDLQRVYREVASEVPAEFGDIGAAVGEINTRLDLTGDKLKTASVEFLKFAKVNEMDVNTSVQLVTRAMGDAGIKAEDYASLLDMLTVAGQKSGVSMESLTTNLAKYGAPMRALGIDTKNAIAMFAGWEKAGVNTEIAFSGMKKAISNWGAAGKDSTKEFSKTLNEIAKCPTIAKATTKAIQVFGAKAGPDLADAIKGGRFEFEEYVKALENGSGTLQSTYSQIVDEVDDTQLAMQNAKLAMHDAGEIMAKTLGPILLDLSKKFKGLMERFDKLSDKEKKQILNMGLMVASIGPAVKIFSIFGKGVSAITKGIGTFSQAIGVMKTGMESTNISANKLAKGIEIIKSPATITATAVIAATAIIISQIKKAEEETKKSLNNIGTGASDFITGINSATSHLESFNNTLFASAEEQQKLQENMDKVQKGITDICKKASDERRDYTQEEIKQLDEYFNKLRELKNRELEIQKSISNSIAQQAEQSSQTFQGTLEEYKINAQEWIKTAQEQKDREISIINERTTQEIALLQQRYGEKATLDNEEYAREYNLIQENKNKAIQEANDQVAQVNLAFSNGYLERAKQDDGFYTKYQEYNKKIEEENQRNIDTLNSIQDNALLTQANKNATKEQENYRHQNETKKIWDKMYKDMSDEQEKELGVWLANVAQTEMYGGKLDDETKKIVKGIMDSYESMPDNTKKTMQETMAGMLKGMEEKEPTLFSKASGIADGILSRLRKTFDIHSPSRKTRKIFQYVMEGAELGLQDEEASIYKQIDRFTTKTLNKLKDINVSDMQLNTLQIQDFGKLQGKLSSQIVDSTKTVFTTPQIIFNVNELDEAKLQQCFNYINKKFGSAY